MRLQEHVTEWRDRPFLRGHHDCALFAADAVFAMTGLDISAGLRGYETEAEGLALIRSHGFDSLFSVFAHHLPKTERLKHGDIAAIHRDGDDVVGVCQGRGIYVMTQIHGLALVPKSWAKGGFAV